MQYAAFGFSLGKLDLIEEQFYRDLAHFGEWLRHGRHRRGEMRRIGLIVEGNNRNVLRDPQLLFRQGTEGS